MSCHFVRDANVFSGSANLPSIANPIFSLSLNVLSALGPSELIRTGDAYVGQESWSESGVWVVTNPESLWKANYMPAQALLHVLPQKCRKQRKVQYHWYHSKKQVTRPSDTLELVKATPKSLVVFTEPTSCRCFYSFVRPARFRTIRTHITIPCTTLYHYIVLYHIINSILIMNWIRQI